MRLDSPHEQEKVLSKSVKLGTSMGVMEGKALKLIVSR